MALMTQDEYRRCQQWQAMFNKEFPTLRLYFWKDMGGGYEVQVRRMTGVWVGGVLLEDRVPTIFFGQFPSPEFIAKCAIIA